MERDSIGYKLNAHLRGQRNTPTTRMVDVLASLAFEMRQAAQGSPVLVEQWVTWARKDRANGDALFRVLCLLAALGKFTPEDIEGIRRDLQQTSISRQRAPKLIREPTSRQSPRLW